MKLALFALVAVGYLVAVVRSVEEEYDYEEEPAAPVTPPPARSNSPRLGGLLSPRGRVNVPRKTSSAAVTQSTTTKPIEPAVEAEEEGEEEFEENQEQQEEQTPTTTTESSKIVRGGVRPFRSNQDLLAALKRRRAQVGPSSSHKESSATQTATESTTTKSKGASHNRNKSNNGASESKTSGRGRFGATRGSKPVQEEVEETQREEVQVKPKPYRRG